MPAKELFNQTQANIADNERLAFSSPGVEGAKNITWANLKNLLANFFLRLTGNQTVDGTKTFNASPIVPSPTLDNHATNRKFVLDEIENTGDVTGPASSVNNHIAVFDGETGKVIKDSGISFVDIRGVVGTSIDSGLESTINEGDNTKIDVAAGRAIIANNYTNPAAPTITVIEKVSPTIAIPITNILTQDITYIGIDVNGDFIQSPTLWTEEQTRDIASISLIVHPDGIIDSITNVGIWNKDSLPSFNDLILTLGRYINKDGNVYSANGANLNINKSAGTAFAYGGNYGANKKNPNLITLGAESAINFILSKSQAGTFVRTQNVPNTQYEPGKDGNLVDLTDGYFVAHRIYLSVSTGETAIQYGQYQYESQKKAVNSWDKEVFTKAPEYANILLKGVIVIKKGTTDLTNDDNVKFINVGDFGDKLLNEVPTYSRYGEPVELLDGLSDQRQNITLIESSGTIYAEVERDGGGDMRYIFGQKEYILNCTTGPGTSGKARVSLTAGASASSPTYNYVYVIRSGDIAILQASTTRPSGEFAYVGVCLIPDAVTFSSEGPYQFQRYSDSKEFDGRSSVQRTNERLRQLPGLYESGMFQTVTINTGPSPDSVDFSITAGKGWQKHLQDTPALQVSIDGIYIINHPTTPYLKITDLNDPEALQTADGTSLADTRFNWVIWLSVNKNGFVKLYLNLPNGSYIVDQNAIDDPNQTAVTTIPKEYRGTGLLIARLPIRHRSIGGGTYENLANSLLSRDVIDLRGQTANVGAGGGLIPASTVFADDVFRIFDNANLWEMGYELAALTANRTLNIQDKNGTVALHEDVKNGLKVENGDVKLGGALTEDTTLIHDVNGKVIGEGWFNNGSHPYKVINITDGVNTSTYTLTAEGLQYLFPNSSTLIVGVDALGVSLNNIGLFSLREKELIVDVENVGGITLTDGPMGCSFRDDRATPRGLGDYADYSANKQDNDYVTKKMIVNANNTIFEATKTEAFASLLTLDLSTRSSFSVEITGNITIDATNLVDGQVIVIEGTINTVTPPTIALAAKFIAIDDSTPVPNANGDKFWIIGLVDGTNINFNVITKIA